MNPKIFVGVAIATLAIILGGILLVGPTIVIPSVNNTGNSATSLETQPIQIELDGITVSKFSQRSATIDIAFKISNPNTRSIIVQTMDYRLFAAGYSENEPIAGGEIGSRPTGMVEFGSNYYTLLGENSIILRDSVTLRNSGNTPQLWADFQDGTTSWKVLGDVFYNLSSVTSGQENQLHFEFTK